MSQINNFSNGILLILSLSLGSACPNPHSASSTSQTSSSPEARSSPAPTATVATTPTATAQSTPQNPEDRMPRVRVEEAIQLVKTGKAIIIDVRGTETYKTAHIKSALDIPLERLESGDFKGLPRNKQIIAYCT